MTTPTPDQVASVQQSLQNIGSLLRDTHNFILGVIPTLFQVEEQTTMASTPLWQLAGASIFLGVVGCIPTVGALVAGVCGAVMVVAMGNTEPSTTDFGGTVADVSNWLDASFLQAIEQVDTLTANVVSNWDQSYTIGGQTFTLGDLANNPVPALGTAAYDTLLQAARLSTQQALWGKTLDSLFMVVDFKPGGPIAPSYRGTSVADVKAQINANPSNLSDMTRLWVVSGAGTQYMGTLSRLAYNHGGDLSFMPSAVGDWIFLDDPLAVARPVADDHTAFFTHANVFGQYDPTTGNWIAGTGCITRHLPFGT